VSLAFAAAACGSEGGCNAGNGIVILAAVVLAGVAIYFLARRRN